MAFWKKGKAESSAEEKKAGPDTSTSADVPARVEANNVSSALKPPQVAPQRTVAGRQQDGGEAAAKTPAAGGARRQNAISMQDVRRAVAFGQVIGLMTRSASLREVKVGALPAVVMPAIQLGQFSVAQARDAEGRTAPIGAVLSDAIDADLSKGAARPALQLKDWRSGPHHWLMLQVGDDRVIAGIVQQLKATQLKGQKLKRIVRKEGAAPTVEVL